MATLRPLQDRIVIKQEKIEQPANSLIVVPDSVKQTPTEGTVVAVGPGRYIDDKLVPTIVQPGDRVLFAKGTGMAATVDQQAYLVMHEGDILGIVK